ncbi:MAG TPA: hypothetical protein VLC08_01155 [Chitinolyticbacter sp.]|nr:hypothetical protein [Chitinolyticbacter sp.]
MIFNDIHFRWSVLVRFAGVLILSAACVGSISGCLSDSESPQEPAELASQNMEGAQYRDALAQTIARADRIVVTEHSYEYDAIDENTGRSLLKEEIVYRKVTLNAAQKSHFRTAIQALETQMPEAVSACIFEPHHTIRFYAGDKLLSQMDICFLCYEVEWSASSNIPPVALADRLARFIESIGLAPERDWKQLARQLL